MCACNILQVACKWGVLYPHHPEALLNSVWMNHTLHFGLRGRQEHLELLLGENSLHSQSERQKTEMESKTQGDSSPRCLNSQVGNIKTCILASSYDLLQITTFKQRGLRRACTFSKSRLSLLCSKRQSLEV